MTVLEFGLFQKINLSEFYNQGWSKNNKETAAPNVLAVIRKTNEFSLWTATIILEQPTQQKRIRAVQKFIRVAMYCKQYNNFNSLMALLGGLSMWQVVRIVPENKLKERSRTQREQLDTLMHPQNNWLNYRTELKKVKGPVLPYLGLFLRDITFIEEGNVDYLATDIINFEKIMLLGEQLNQIESFQCSDFSRLSDNKNPSLEFLLHHLHPRSEDQLKKLSMSLQPDDLSEEDSSGSSKSSYFVEELKQTQVT